MCAFIKLKLKKKYLTTVTDIFVLVTCQELIAEEIAKNFTTYSRLFYSNNFSGLIG